MMKTERMYHIIGQQNTHSGKKGGERVGFFDHIEGWFLSDKNTGKVIWQKGKNLLEEGIWSSPSLTTQLGPKSYNQLVSLLW